MAAGDVVKAMSVELSKRIADEVSAYNTDGILFTSVQRLSAINSARQKIYAGMLKELGPDGFMEMFPEFLAETTGITVTANVGAKASTIRKILTLELTRSTTNAGTYLCRRLPKEVYYEMTRAPEGCPYQTGAADYGYIEINNTVRFYGETSGTIAGTYSAIYLKDIADILYTEDAPDPAFWREQIIKDAAEILLSQSRNK